MQIPARIQRIASRLKRHFRKRKGSGEFVAQFSSSEYWSKRYASGGNSGAGSYGKLANFKAAVINELLNQIRPESVIEFGCGDGNQLKLYEMPTYIGIDISEKAVTTCRKEFGHLPSMSFLTLKEYSGQMADLALSVDVIYHLVEDDVFHEYMTMLFAAAREHVIVYSSNRDYSPQTAEHVRHREFLAWINLYTSEWRLVQQIPNKYSASDLETKDPNESFADFYVFRKFPLELNSKNTSNGFRD